jgi:dimeric dUTPase (all-alpha-NTP-PPase superfamily)
VNLETFYSKQEELEQFVRKNLGISEEEFSSVPMVDKRIFAFKVEIAEFSNETAWFKYWKQSHVMDRGKVLEELADCIHFLLAIGIYRKYRNFVHSLDWEFHHTYKQEEQLYHDIMNNPIGSAGQWKTAFEQLIAIGIKLGYTLEEIELAYYLKNQENIERQMRNY